MNFKSWAKRLVVIAVIVEVAWVLLINVALHLPLTQPMINQIRPAKFHVSWDSAWSWFPGHVRVHGAFANGQSRSQQWQFKASSVSGSISLLPLVFKRVWVNSVTGVNIDYRQRPRLKEDHDYRATMPHLPDIEGREMAPADTSPRKNRRPWYVSIDDIRVEGDHKVWIYRFQGSLSGEIDADLKVRSRGGPFSLDANHLDLELGKFSVDGAAEVFPGGRLAGAMGFAEFVPRQNRGPKMLPFLKLDLEVDVDLNNLDFIDLFTQNFDDVSVNGRGGVKGRLRYDQGSILEGTGLSVDADDLQLQMFALNISGDGAVGVRLGQETGQALDLSFKYRGLQVRHNDDTNPLLTGRNLELHLGGNGFVLKSPGGFNPSRSIAVDIEGLSVPDLALLQRYLPEKWPLRLHGGVGTLSGSIGLAPASLSVDLRIESQEADMGLRQYRFDTNLDAVLRLENAALMQGGTQLAGTYVELSEARLKKDGLHDPPPWDASLRITDGELTVFDTQQKTGEEHAFDLLQELGNSEASEVLGNSKGLLHFEAGVSSLAWLGVFLSDQHPSRVDGQSTITGGLFLDNGLPAVGTQVEVLSQAMSVGIMDYVSTGTGRIALEVSEGGDFPDWLVDISLTDGAMRRTHETVAGLRGVELSLKALVEDVSFEPGDKEFTLEFSMPTAKVSDMSVFNGYLPADTPLKFAGGSASLTSEIVLQREDADGWLRLASNDLQLRLDDQLIEADLNADVVLAGGVPANMFFDISGSTLRLGRVRVAGDSAEFDEREWSTEFTLTRAETIWRDPLSLNAEGELSMSDSRPIVAIFNNQDQPPKWLVNMLTVEDIRGTAQMHMADDRIVIPHAHAISDHIEVGAKGVIENETSNGVFFARYKKLSAIIKVQNGKRNLDIIRPRKKYDEYQLPP